MKSDHNCIEKVREALMKDNPSINYIVFDLCTIQNIEEPNPFQKTGQRITIDYNKKMKRGGIQRKREMSFITHNFCPFCGEKYEKEVQDA